MADAKDNFDEIIIDASEYQFDIEDIKTPISNHCLRCNKKFTSCINLAICKACESALTINKTRVINIYNLEEAALENIDYYQRKNIFCGITNLYLLKEIRLLAIKMRFNLINPSFNTYTNCVETLLSESKERNEERAKTKERNKQLREEKKQKAKRAHPGR